MAGGVNHRRSRDTNDLGPEGRHTAVLCRASGTCSICDCNGPPGLGNATFKFFRVGLLVLGYEDCSSRRRNGWLFDR